MEALGTGTLSSAPGVDILAGLTALAAAPAKINKLPRSNSGKGHDRSVWLRAVFRAQMLCRRDPRTYLAEAVIAAIAEAGDETWAARCETWLIHNRQWQDVDTLFWGLAHAADPRAARGQPMTGRGPRSWPATTQDGHDRAMHQRPPPDRLPLQITRQSRAYWLLWPSGSLRLQPVRRCVDAIAKRLAACPGGRGARFVVLLHLHVMLARLLLLLHSLM